MDMFFSQFGFSYQGETVTVLQDLYNPFTNYGVVTVGVNFNPVVAAYNVGYSEYGMTSAGYLYEADDFAIFGGTNGQIFFEAHDLNILGTWDTTVTMNVSYDVLTSENDTFAGNDYGDKIFAGFGNDVVIGNGGDDYLAGAQGNDTIDGGSGYDEVWFYGSMSDYNVTRNGDGSIRVASLFDGSVDKVLNSELFNFGGAVYETSDLFPVAQPSSYAVYPNSDAIEGGALTFTIYRSGDTSGTETIYFNLSGQAVAGGDYTAPASSVTFGAGEVSKNVSLATFKDGLIENFETVVMTLTGTSNGGLVSLVSAQSGIINADVPISQPPIPQPPIVPPTLEEIYSGNDTLVGNSGNNTLRGYGGNDVIKSGSGNDLIFGGLGNDKLYGQAGKDAFVFDTKPNQYANKDAIMDFRVVDDTIRLDNAIFTKVGANGTLKEAMFWTNTTGKAHDSSDRVIYDRDSGVLYYDPDGTGKAAGVAFATISKELALTYKDFYVI
jgi:serralysin